MAAEFLINNIKKGVLVFCKEGMSYLFYIVGPVQPTLMGLDRRVAQSSETPLSVRADTFN